MSLNLPTFRILTVGDSSVGKTSLITRFTVFYIEDMNFSYNRAATIGVNFKCRNIIVNEQMFQLSLWDTAGQERFHHMNKSFYKKANGIAIIYDVTNPITFASLNYWIEEVNQNTPENSIKILVANKVDLGNSRKISERQGLDMAEKFKLKYFECSAKDDIGVFEAFDYIGKKILSYHQITKSYLCHDSKSILLHVNTCDVKRKSKC